MARQGKTLPARRQNATNGSLLIRSAESLGRVIGSLQRQLDGARRVAARANGADVRGEGHKFVRRQNAGVAAKAPRKTEPVRVSTTSNARVDSDRKSKRAAKSAAKKKTGSRTRSGAKQRRARKSRGT
jgi:hypothetical protein